MQAITRRLLFWGIIAALVLAGLTAAFTPRSLPVDVDTVQRGTLRVMVEDEGKTRVHDIYVISAPVTGRMRRIDLHVGDAVVASETVVAEIEPIDPAFLDPRGEAQARADIRAAESAEAVARAQVEQAQAELDFAHREFDRARELVPQGTISQRELDDAERAYRTRRAALLTMQAALDRSTYELERSRAQLLSPAQTERNAAECDCIALRAPVDGRILQLLQQSEGVVTAGTPLVDVGDARDLEIAVDLLSADAVRVEAGQRVIIDGWGGDQALEGRVRLVEPFGYTKVSALGIEEQRVNVVIDIISPAADWQRLAHGYQVDARIVLAEHVDVLTVPLTALFRDGPDWAVFVAEADRARLRQVTLGDRNGSQAEVREGLAEGERVVLHPSDRIAQGVRIRAN
ncbi:MAG: HlyD family efflux transporter periplasmic adaptor subunit [Gammaproteobacteria bacterium]|nr:HlyD family efflux transporter periplasmic adaptor subunit [Gammaproteobacteria bacterium]